MKSAANSNLKMVTLELGGKSPAIIYDDSYLDDAVKWVGSGNVSVFGNFRRA